ncbi:cell surface protein [Pseudoalteromonas nigrifaciens]|uniref:cell surface protein n=1 Tax=Pseudoalteromonas nigrifaciens TaxID=28109 RepID=UPI001867DC09|nr:cell surface protein [Pseudoalteromonas nigrifaciens]
MIKILTRLTLCVALFYSFNSAAYNQAMCILIKQEMQQHSNNKTSRSYRNAARDYNKNCNKPVATPTQPKPRSHTIVNDPEPQNALPEPITESIPTPIAEPLKTHSEADNTASINTEPQASPSQTSQVTTDEPIANIKSSDVKSADIKNPAAESTQTNTTEISAEPIAVAQKPASVKPAPVSKTNNESATSLLLPSLLLLLIVLIGVMVLVRMRRAKQSSSEVATVLPTSPAATTPVTKQVTKPAAKPNPSTVNIQNTTTAQPAAESVSMQQIDAALAKPQASTSEPETVVNTTNTTFSNEKPKTKPEPNTAEFEAAAKNTLERIKNASDFAEPEVRMFDPDAPLPTKKQRQQQVTQQVPAAINNQTPPNTIEPANISPEPIIAQQPTTNIHSPVSSTEQATSFNTEHEFKEPEVRTFDPDAPLPGSKAKPIIKADTSQQPKPIAEPKAQNMQIDNSNPFANLSLDDSWDPNSSVKPKIAEKKREPKSQALIEAEQRAKNMQTKE